MTSDKVILCKLPFMVYQLFTGNYKMVILKAKASIYIALPSDISLCHYEFSFMFLL